LLVSGGCSDGDNRVLAPPPQRHFGREDEAPPQLPRTVVDVPLLLDLSAAVELLESALPSKLGDINRRQQIPGKKRAAYAYELRREPFEVSVKGDTFQIASTIHYQGKGWFDPPIGPEIGGSCGTKGPEPRARVVVTLRPELDRNWRLVAQPRLRALVPLTKTEQDQCEVSFLKLDVTEKVLAAARSAVRAQLPRISAQLATLDVKREFEKVWNEIQKPIRLADSVWLVLQPRGVRLGKVSGTNTMVGTTVGIDAQPRIETGDQPSVALAPLPPLDSATDATGLHMLVEGRLEYPVIGAALTEALVGKRITAPGGFLEIEEIGIFGVGSGRVALGVRFGGTSAGQIYFVGTPQYDTTTGRIMVPDLDYDASTSGLLMRGLAWLKDDEIRNFLRANATFPSTDALERITNLAAKGMNRELAPGVSLSAAVDRTDVLRIVPRPEALILQARASGQAALHITDAFFGKLQSKIEREPNAPRDTAADSTGNHRPT
jgi:hypothetical protein